jgi:NAD(P)-dependent dehydrogenase (short-subunit alcohol dehydrogenase family)
MDMNLTAIMLSNQAAVRTWKSLNQGGSILNMGSALAIAASPEYFATHAYSTAKFAIEGFTRAVAAYYAPFNIRVNMVAPGLTDTPMAQRAAGNDTILSYVKTKQPLEGGRIGRPEDVDGIAVYFLSDASRFTTGQLVAVDGGWSISEGQKTQAGATGKD